MSRRTPGSVATKPVPAVRHRARAGDAPILASLNDRQRRYLGIAYETDQSREDSHRAAFKDGRYNEARRKASEWRWLGYNIVGGMYHRIPAAHRDPGTGSTWAALADRGLLVRKWEPGELGIQLLFVKLTPLGRRIGSSCVEAREDVYETWRREREAAEQERARRVAAAPAIPLPADAIKAITSVLRSGDRAMPATRMLVEELLKRAAPGPDALVSASVEVPLSPDEKERALARQKAAKRRRLR